MKGLLKKEWYIVKYDCRSYLILMGIFFVFNSFPSVKASGFENPIVWIFPSTIVISLLGFDERYKWDNYCQELPVSVENMVDSKYITGFILVTISILFSIILGLAFKKEMNIESILSCLTIAFMSFTLTAPVYFRYGSNKGRLAYYVLIGFVVVFASIVSSKDFQSISKFANTYTLFFASIVLFVVSRFVSIFLYKRRLNEKR